MLEADFQSYIEKLEHNVDQYVENAKKGQTNNDQGNNLLEMYEKAFEACNLRYTEIQKNLVAFYKLYKTFHSKNQQHISSAQEVISGYGILGKALVLLDVFKKLDGTLNDETIKKIEPLKNKIDSLRREMKNNLPELNDLFDESDITLERRDISDAESIKSDEEFFDAVSNFDKDEFNSNTLEEDNLDAEELSSSTNEYSELEKKAKTEFSKYIENGAINSVSIKKTASGNLYAEVTLQDNEDKNKDNQDENTIIKIDEWLYSKFCTENNITHFSILNDNQEKIISGYIDKEKVRHYDLGTTCTHGMQFKWFVDGKECSIILTANSDGSIEIVGSKPADEDLEKNKSVKIKVGDSYVSLADAVKTCKQNSQLSQPVIGKDTQRRKSM